jgi:hypothetical protein
MISEHSPRFDTCFLRRAADNVHQGRHSRTRDNIAEEDGIQSNFTKQRQFTPFVKHFDLRLVAFDVETSINSPFEYPVGTGYRNFHSGCRFETKKKRGVAVRIDRVSGSRLKNGSGIPHECSICEKPSSCVHKGVRRSMRNDDEDVVGELCLPFDRNLPCDRLENTDGAKPLSIQCRYQRFVEDCDKLCPLVRVCNGILPDFDELSLRSCCSRSQSGK